jgi:uncharacterized protein (TIGR02646 family)
MIKLSKSDIVCAARKELEERSTRLKSLIDTGDHIPQNLLDSYRQAEVKALLKQETCEKCIYCESKISHIYYGDVEHILPKSRFPRRTLDYSNLSYACAICNNNKSDYHEDALPLINPYVDDPAENFLALGPFITRRPGQDRAKFSELRLELNRTALVERRQERLESLCNLADVFQKTSPGPLRDVLEAQLLQESADDKEYSFVVRAYLAAVQMPPSNLA